jgi:ribosomal protein S12 methylthiotransferase accessory factor
VHLEHTLNDASLASQLPVIAMPMRNPLNATVFASFGAHPYFEVALERNVIELLQAPRGLSNN